MKKIAGDIEVMPVGDVVSWLAHRGSNGTLFLKRGNVERSFTVASGMVLQGRSNDPREYLGQHLLNFGYVGEDALAKAFQTQRETNVPLGRILIMVGHLNDDQLERVLGFKVRESLLDAFEWQFGSFALHAGEEGDPLLNIGRPFALAEAHSEAMSRRDLWHEMRTIFPTGDLRLEVNPNAIPASAGDSGLLDLLRSGRTIADLLLELRALEFHLYARLYDLFQRGFVRPLLPDAPSISAPVRTAPGELLRVALKDHDYESAYHVAQQMLDRDANDPEALAAIRIAEAHMQSAVQQPRTFNGAMLPVLTMPAEQIMAGNFTTKERYVLSRIDGIRTLSQIIQVSPISEAEFMRIMQKLTGLGLVGFK